MKRLLPLLILLFVAAALSAQTTLTLNDAVVVQPAPLKSVPQINSINYYDSGQILKNLIGADNPHFEPLQFQQIWALSAAGTTTTFCSTNKFDNYPVGFFTGATIAFTESAGANLGFTATITTNTAGTPGTTPPCYTFSPAAPVATAPGDIINLVQLQSPTPEAVWEASSNGVWANVQHGGKMLSDTATPHAGTQSLVFDVTAGSTAVAGVTEYFDSTGQNHFVLLNGTYRVTGWMRLVSGANTTLAVCAGRQGTATCNNFTPTSSWTQFTFTPTFTETNTTSLANGMMSATIQGSNGLGQVEVDDLDFEKTSGQNPSNTTVLRDEVYQAYRDACASTVGVPCLIRNWSNQNGETIANWTLPDNAQWPTASGHGADTNGTPTLSLYDYLFAVHAVGGIPYLEIPVTMSNADGANLVEFLSSTNTSSGYGQIRANLGQTAPWVGPGGVFPEVDLTFCNECWNGASFIGQALPFRSGVTDYYFDYANRAKDVYAAMRSDGYFNSGIQLGFNLQLGVNYQPGAGGLQAALNLMATVHGSPDNIEQAPYTQLTVSNWQTSAALWGAANAEPYGEATNPNTVNKYFQAVTQIQAYNLCGPAGTSQCKATNYEQNNSTVETCGVGQPACTGGSNQEITQAVEDLITAGSGEGMISAYQVAANLKYLGVTHQNPFGLSEFDNGTLGGLATIAKLWGDSVDYGGATSYLNGLPYTPRPQSAGLQVLSAGVIGPEFQCNLGSTLPYNWVTDGVNGPVASQSNVPSLDSACFKNTSTNQRSIVFFGTTLTAPGTVNISGTNAPSGTCTIWQYAPTSPSLLNESHTGTPTNTTALTTNLTKSTGACPSSVNVPADSVTTITWSIGGTPTANPPVLSPGAGTYAAAQSVTATNPSSAPVLCYTTNGTTPATNGATGCTTGSVYSGAITVSSSQTVKILAGGTAFLDSSVTSAAYTINGAATAPAFTPAAGTYSVAQSVTLSNPSGAPLVCYNTTGASIVINGVGSCPGGSTQYTGAISVPSSTTLHAVAGGATWLDSTTTSAAYVIATGLAAPVISPPNEVSSSPVTVSITGPGGGATICYAINSAPTAPTPGTCGGGSTTYTGSFTVSSSSTVEALTTQSGRTNSSVATATYVIGPTLTFTGKFTGKAN